MYDRKEYTRSINLGALLILIGLGGCSSYFWIETGNSQLRKYENTNTEPKVVLPGDRVKLILRRTLPALDDPQGNPLWKASSLELNSIPIILENGELVFWHPQNIQTNHAEWKRGDRLPIDVDRRTGYPIEPLNKLWVQFTVPQNEELAGNKVKVFVKMDVTFPVANFKKTHGTFKPKVGWINFSYTHEDTTYFKVTSILDHVEYLHIKRSVQYIQGLKIALITIGIIVFIIGLIILNKSIYPREAEKT